MLEGLHLLPDSRRLDIGALSQLFDDATTSYKHLFFQAILNGYRDRGFAGTRFTFKTLTIGMLEAAWYPSKVFHLTLGSQDQVSKFLDGMAFGEGAITSPNCLRATLEPFGQDCQRLLRYVPFRLLTPFFSQQLKGKCDDKKQDLIRSFASEFYDTIRPLYKFVGLEEIELHPDWAMYIAENFPIVFAWAERRWIAYLQSRNPTVPAVSEKTKRPSQRNSLAAQTLYWEKIINEGKQPIRCIYSGSIINGRSFHLDHFLPWTFVCHDAIWNLVPVVPEANLSKHNSLPDKSYIPAVAAIQHIGLTTARRIMTTAVWERVANTFIGDLRIAEDAILDHTQIESAYDLSIGAQLNIARAIGFKPNWIFTEENGLATS